MTRVKKMLLDTELRESVDTCRVHSKLVDVLLALDGRLLRLEIILVVTCLAAVGGTFKSVLLPIALKLLGT